jgi:hypothetical protein
MFISVTQHSADVRAIAELLADTTVGETATYAAMSAAIGREIRDCRYIALRALKVVNDETGALFSAVRGVGYRRLPMAEAADVGQSARQRIRATSRRARKHITNAIAKANDLPSDLMRKVNAELSALGLIEHISRDKAVSDMGDEARPLPVAVAADSFMKHIGAK